MSTPLPGPRSGPRTREPATLGRRDGVGVAVAAGVSALAGYVALAVAARTLTVADNTVFVTFWSTVFACFGVLSGLSMEVTRAVTAAGTGADAAAVVEGAARPARVLAVGAGTGLVLAGVGSATSGWWGPALLPTADARGLALLVCAAVALYAGHSVVVGALAGARSWRTYTGLITADAAVRLVLVVAVLAAGAHVVGAAVAVVVATTVWLVALAVSPRARRAAGARADSGARVLVRRVVATSVAQGAGALLVVGFPVLLSLTTPAADYATAAPLLLAVALTRAPLLVPLNAYQGVAVTHFVAHRDAGWRALVPVLRAVVALGAVAALGAFLVGPWLLGLVLGPAYALDGALLAGLAGAAAVIAVLTLTGAMCQALTAHTTFVAGWLVALAATTALLLLPAPIEVRCVVALAGGPLIGVAVHLTRLLRGGGRA